MIITIPTDQFERLAASLDEEPQIVPALLELVRSVRAREVDDARNEAERP